VQIEFSHAVQAATDSSGAEISGEAICALFAREYFETAGPARRVNASTVRWEDRDVNVAATNRPRGPSEPQDAQHAPHEQHARRVAAAFAAVAGQTIEVISFESTRTTDGRTAVFAGCRVGEQAVRYGVGVSPEAATAVMDAVVSAVNRAIGTNEAVGTDMAEVVNPAVWQERDRRVAA
jgi:2-isopropylmalate synthase